MLNSLPYEVLGSPFEVYIAPPGTAKPDIDVDPTSPWAKVGTQGFLNHFPEGVSANLSQGTNVFRSAGSTAPRKIFRTEEDAKFGLTIADLTAEQFAIAVNDNTVTTVAAGVGTPGTKTVGLSRGLSVATYALLLKGPSPAMEDGACQFYIPRVAQTGSPNPSFRNGEAAGLALEFTALVDETADHQLGLFEVQTADAES